MITQDAPSPLTVALSISLRWPELARRVGEAVRLVEAGQVFHLGDGRYCVNGMYYTVQNKMTELDDRGYRFIDGGTVLVGGGYYCDCPDFSNGLIGWYHPVPPLVELEPGVWVRPCAHVLAVYIARQIETEVVR